MNRGWSAGSKNPAKTALGGSSVDYNGHPPDCNDTGRLGALPTWEAGTSPVGEPRIAPPGAVRGLSARPLLRTLDPLSQVRLDYRLAITSLATSPLPPLFGPGLLGQQSLKRICLSRKSPSHRLSSHPISRRMCSSASPAPSNASLPHIHDRPILQPLTLTSGIRPSAR